MERAFDKRLTACIVLVVALLIVDACLTYESLRQLHQDAHGVAQTYEVLNALEEVESTMKDAENGEQGYLLSGDRRYLQPYAVAVTAIEQRVERVRALTADSPRWQANLDALQYLIAIKLQGLEQRIAQRS